MVQYYVLYYTSLLFIYIYIHISIHMYIYIYVYMLHSHDIPINPLLDSFPSKLSSYQDCAPRRSLSMFITSPRAAILGWFPLWKDPPFSMGKSTISMVIFNSYVKLLEGTRGRPPSCKLVTVYISPWKLVRYITNKNHSEIGVICTNLAIPNGHHLMEDF